MYTAEMIRGILQRSLSRRLSGCSGFSMVRKRKELSMNGWRVLIPAAAAVIILTGISGCYTMLSHPAVQYVDEVTGEEGDQITHSQRCTDCHTGEVHGRGHGFRDHPVSSAYGNWYDYDPFWNSGSYYDPWFWGATSFSSPYFYDQYYGYRSVPWWLYNTPDQDNSSENGGGSAASSGDKPTRRGDMGENRRDSFSPISGVPRPSSGGVERPATTTPSAPSGDTDQDKDKPARRGGMR